MRHFRVFFARELGVTITEMMIGLGTDGELKDPSYENLVGHLFFRLSESLEKMITGISGGLTGPSLSLCVLCV